MMSASSGSKARNSLNGEMMVHNFPNIRKVADRDPMVGVRPDCRIKMVPLYGRNHSSNTGIQFGNEHSTWRSQLLCKSVRKTATPIEETDSKPIVSALQSITATMKGRRCVISSLSSRIPPLLGW